MPVSFMQPSWAVLAAIMLLAGAALAAVCRRQSFRWRAAGIILPVAAAACIALALAGTSVSRRAPVAIVLDFSRSARVAPWHDPEWVRQLAQRRLGPHQPLAVLAQDGARQRVLIAQTTPAAIWPAGFNWDSAAPADDASMSPRPQWLITDGLIPPPDKMPAAVTIVRPESIDAGIRDVVIHAAGEEGGKQTLEILVQLRASAWPAGQKIQATATLKLERDGKLLSTATKDFAADAGHVLSAGSWITFRDALTPEEAAAPHEYAATVALAPRPDSWPENDRGSIIWPGNTQAPRVLTISNRQSGAPGVIRPERFFMNASQLAAEGWQAIILDDIPAFPNAPGNDRTARPLTTEQVEQLNYFVRITGGGLLIASRASAFGPGHYGEGLGAAGELEALSPVWSRPHDSSGSAIIFVLDASASMNAAAGGERKFSLLSRAVEKAAGYLADNDAVALITFNRQAQLLARGTSAATWAALPERLKQVQPQGETAPDSALALLAGTLAAPEFHSATVIFLTDGEIPAMDAARWKQTLAGSPLVIVAPPPAPAAAGPSPLEKLAASGINARWQNAADPAEWQTIVPQLVLDKTRGALHREPLPWRAGTLTGTAPSWIETWLKPESQPIAQGPRNQPVAAIAQRGLGQVAAVTIPDDASPARGALQMQILRRILAPPGDRRFHAAATRQPDGTWLVTADGLDGNSFLNNESLTVACLDGADPGPALKLTQTAPGHYQAALPPFLALPLPAPTFPTSHGLTAIISRRAGTEQQLVARLQTADVQTAEYPASVDVPWEPGAGSGIAILSAAPDNGDRWEMQTAHSLAPWLWLAAAALAVIAVWLRM